MMRRALVLLPFAVVACGNSESATVTVDLAALYQHAAQGRVPIDFVELSVTGEGVDLDPVTIDSPALEFELEVPAGRARVFAIEAWQQDATGGSQRLTTYWGAATHDLAPRTEVDITIPIVPAGRVYGTVSLPDDVVVPADVDLTFTASDPRSEVPGVLTVTASSGAFSVPLPVGEYTVTALVVVGGTTYRLPPGTTVEILRGQVTGPVDLTLVASSGASQVTVTVAERGSPLPDVAVLLNAADGTFKSQTATDPSGIALLDAASGDMVTLAHADDGSTFFNLITVAAVEPGDVLPFEVGISDQMTQPIGTLTVNVPNGYGRATNYRVSIGSSEASVAAGASSTLSVNDDCVNSTGTIDLVATAEDPDGVVVATYVAAGLQATGDHSVTVGAWDAATSLPMSVQVANASDLGASYVSIDLALRRDGVRYGLSGLSGYVSSPDWPVFTANVPTGLFHTIDVTSTYTGTNSSGEMRERFVSDTWDPTVMVDLADSLPAATAVTVDEADPARPEVAWTTTASAAEFDVTLVSVGWYMTVDPYLSLSWNLMLPPGTHTPLTLPQIPPTLPSFQPQAYPELTYSQVELVDYSFLIGFRAWVSQVGPPELSYHAKDFWPQTPATSRRTQSW